MPRAFTLAFDYLCPFARNANEHVLDALAGGADLEVTFLPFSLAQAHVTEGQPAVWEQPEPAPGVLALQVAVDVRDHQPERFLAVHRALFAARHDEGGDLKDRALLRSVVEDAGACAAEVFARIDTGEPLQRLQVEHELAAERYGVWGVPTFATERRAVFVRMLDRPSGDTALAAERIHQVLDLVDGHPDLHEFKQVDLPV